MYVTGKSDGGIVSMKRANNDAQSKTDQPSAEFVEKSPSAEGNFGQTTVTNTQRSEPASSALSRIRDAAKRDSKLQFNNLMHHVNIDLLRQSYFALKRNAAAGIDDVTWQEYGKDIEAHLPDLHDRVQSEQ